MLENVFHSFSINQETIFENFFELVLPISAETSCLYVDPIVELDLEPFLGSLHDIFRLNNLDIGILKGA